MHKYIYITVLWILFLLISCDQPADNTLNGPYFGVAVSETPTLLAPELLATPLTEYNGTFSPDGTQFFYTTGTYGNSMITMTSMRDDGTWSEPEEAPFSDKYIEYDPLLSPDGKWLYFSSERPIEGYGNTQIWKADLNDLSAPIHIPLTGNGDYYSSLTNSGKIYFNVWSEGLVYCATPTDTGYHIAQVVIPNIDSDIGDPFIDPDEDYLIYRGYGKNSLGRGDFFITFKKDTTWTSPQNLGPEINSPFHEMCPYVTTNKAYFIFASSRTMEEYPTDLKGTKAKFLSHDNGDQNIYVVSADFIERFR